MKDLPRAVVAAVDGRTETILEVVIWKIAEGGVKSFEACYDLVADSSVDETAVIGVDLGDQVTVVVWYAEEYGFEPVPVTDLRSRIEGYAATVVCYLAQEKAREVLEELQEFMDENDFDLSDVAAGNRLENLPHDAERDKGERCTVYEYRNVEGMNVDVWEYRLTDDTRVYFA